MLIGLNSLYTKTDDDLSTVYGQGTPEELMGKKWYHGKISHKVAERKLKTESSGSFLLRSVEKGAASFALSMTYQGKFKHYLIERNVNDEYELQGTEKPFPSILALIDYYTEHPISGSGEKLQTPCSDSGICMDVKDRNV